MNNANLRNLGDYTLTAAVTDQVITSASDRQGVTQAYVDRLEGMLAGTAQIKFNYGSGGATCRVMLDVSLDQGVTWIEVWRALFATASEVAVANLSGLTPVSPFTPAALSDDQVKDGVLGALMRARVTSTGTYAGNTSIAVRLQPR